MKLKRTFPGMIIWAIFILFDVFMVGSLSYFSGLFSDKDNLLYSVIFTVLCVLFMSVLTFMLGKLCDRIKISEIGGKDGVSFAGNIIAALLIIGGVIVRLRCFANSTIAPGGKLSLYNNAMIGGTEVTEEFDILSIFYSAILRGILFFTGNWISVALFFQLGCFTLFVICAFLCLRKLLGLSAGIVFTAYISFMPIFLGEFKSLTLETDSLFMAMFGIELLVMSLFIRGAYLGYYKSPAWILWYLFVGGCIGFMTYVDAGTLIMILPFFLVSVFLVGINVKDEILRLLIILVGAAFAFGGMILQEAGPSMAVKSLENWAGFYFHNLNVVNMFWVYTDYKIIYLITVIAMSGVIVGYWRNRQFEKVTPFLLSMLFIFATVPFMGATRMNTQMFVSIYYAFVLGCVVSLITLSSYEGKEINDFGQDEESLEEQIEEAVPELAGEEETEPEPAPLPVVEERIVRPETSENKPQRFVPEGMILPEDDEDMDAQPRMKMPDIKKAAGLTMGEKLKVRSKETIVNGDACEKKADDFDIAFVPGDDFDL